MAKNVPVVQFSHSDVPKPKKLDGGFISLRAPFPVTLHPQSTVTVDFGISANTHLIVFGSRVENLGATIFPAGMSLKALIKNPSMQDDIVFDIGDTVLLVYPLLPVEFELK